jgi:hypothetical protein
MNEDEDVSAITAAARSDTLSVIKDILGDDPYVLSYGRPGTEITLPAEGVVKLFRECGNMRGTDPRSPQGHEIYDSLARVYYGLMSDD